MPTIAKSIDWDTILETYGPETKVGLNKLLAENGVAESDPAALVIAALFISQIDSNKAFQSITQTIDSGKEQLNEQFRIQILQLRGIVTYAEEHLIQTNEEQVDKRKKEILEVIKIGIAKAIGKRHREDGNRATTHTVVTIVCVALTSIASILVGGGGAFFLSASKSNLADDPVWSATPNAELWVKIAEQNQDKLSVCLKHQAELGGECAISIPR